MIWVLLRDAHTHVVSIFAEGTECLLILVTVMGLCCERFSLLVSVLKFTSVCSPATVRRRSALFGVHMFVS